jgi:hypothetical protein
MFGGMARRRQRDHLGEYTSAALPQLWEAKERRQLSNADMARELDVDDAMIAKLLFAERRAGRDLSIKCRDRYGTPIEAWGEPMPEGWLPPEAPDPADSTTAVGDPDESLPRAG